MLQIIDQKQQLEDTRRNRDDAREELSRWQQTWTREKDEINHKKRQEEKVQQAEQQALQLKYESRMKIMEDSSIKIQSQVSLVSLTHSLTHSFKSNDQTELYVTFQ